MKLVKTASSYETLVNPTISREADSGCWWCMWVHFQRHFDIVQVKQSQRAIRISSDKPRQSFLIRQPCCWVNSWCWYRRQSQTQASLSDITRNTTLCSDSKYLCQCQIFNHKWSGFWIRIAGLIQIWMSADLFQNVVDSLLASVILPSFIKVGWWLYEKC